MEPEITLPKSARHPAASLVVVAVLSSLITAILLLGAVYLLRDYLVSTLRDEIQIQAPSTVATAAEPDQIVSTIAEVNDAVVSVIVTRDVPIYEQYFERFDGWGWFGDMLIPRVRENGTREEEVGGGSGFVVSSDGLVVTNRHVVADTEARYSVVFADGTVAEAEVLARDPQLDIAVLKVSVPDTESLPFLTFGNSDELKLGQTVIAIGNALAEFQNSVSVGVVSGLSRSIVASDERGRSETLNQVIQTDAAINPGNSGGPLLNTQGEVVGVNVATSRGADNIGFALPSKVVEQVVRSVVAYGEIRRPFLGVQYQMVTPALQERLGLSVSSGAVLFSEDETVPAIVSDSPAAQAGLQVMDVITAVDGESLQNSDLATVLRTKQVGQTITLTVVRDDETLELSATLQSAL